MKNLNKSLLTVAALLTLHSTPGWSETVLNITQSETQEEISRLEKNIEKNYQDIKSLNDLGVVHLKLAHYDKAIAQFKKALGIDPVYTLGPVFSGNIYTDAENYQDKIKEFQEVINTNREYARAHNYLGLAYLQQKNYSTAKLSLLESIKINPKYAKAHNNLGVLYEETGQTAKAIESYKMAHKVDPNDPNNLYNLGLAYDSLKDGENSVLHMVLAKKMHERNFGQNGIDRINDKLDQLWAKYADNTKNDSIASLDSNLTGDAASPANTSTNQTSIISSSAFPPLDLSQTSAHTGSSIAYEGPKALTVNLKSLPDLPTLPITSADENHQGKINDELMSKVSIEEPKIKKEGASSIIAALPEKNELTVKSIIEESIFTDSRGTYSHPGSSSESEDKVETASNSSTENKKKMTAKKPEKNTWVSDWVFDYPK